MKRDQLAKALAKTLRPLILGALLAVVGQLAAWPRAVRAEILVVDTTDDVLLTGCGILEYDCSLRGAIHRANNSPGPDEIRFIPATEGQQFILTGAAGEDENVSGDLDILFMGGDLTIKGRGAGLTIIDGGGIDRVFQICPPAGGGCGISVTIEGVTIQNGSEVEGGGVDNYAPSLTIRDSHIGWTGTGNHASFWGGGIFNHAGRTLTLDGSGVYGNTAPFGAGIGNEGMLVVENGSAIGVIGMWNQATFYGGGVYNEGEARVDDSAVGGNKADDLGGGIFNGGTLTVRNGSTVGGYWNGNQATNGGGGIYNSGGTVVVESSAVSANRAADGAGIYNTDTAYEEATLTVRDGSTIGGSGVGNEASGKGGGIYNDGSISGATVTVDGSTVSANTAEDGGGIFNNTGTVTVQNGSTVSANTAQDGGGIYNDGGTATVDGSTVSSNTASTGGGIFNYYWGMLTVDGSTVSDNTAENIGGGIDNNGTLTVRNGSTVNSNTASAGGGLSNGFGGALTVDGSTVSANTAEHTGGGIWNSYGTLTVQNDSTVSGNTAVAGGGLSNGAGGALTVDGSTVSANTAEDDGGGIYNHGLGTAMVDGSTVSANTAHSGGGISNGNHGTLVVQNGSTVSENTAENTGGGIYNWSWDPPDGSESTTVTDSRILYNTAGIDGGGVYDEWDLQWATSVLNSCIVGNSDTAHDSVTQQTATGNWWGAPGGPNTPGADTAGPYIYTEGWLTSPILGCAPDLQIDKANDTGGSGAVGTIFHWTLTVTNNDIANAVFGTGQLILQDDLPSGPTYGTPVPGSFVDITNADNIECRITGSTLTCGKGIGQDVVIGAQGGGFSVEVPVTPQAGGVLTNPAGICRVDPGGNVVENDEGNNDCPADVVNVTTGGTASTTTAITAHDPNPSAVGQVVTVEFTVHSAEGTPTGQVTVSDGTVQCIGALSGGSGSCTLAFPTAGSRVLTATYAGDASFSGSISPGVTHSVGHPLYLPLVLFEWW